MPGKTHIKSGSKAKQKTAHTYNLPENPIEFYISEETSAYEKERPFTIYYDDPADRRYKGLFRICGIFSY